MPAWEFATAREEGSASKVRWHQRDDGTRVCIDGASYARYGGDGVFQGTFKVGQDVTARRATTEALQSIEAMLATGLETAPVAIGVFDASGQIPLANEAMHYYLPSGKISSRDPARLDRWTAYHPDDGRVPPEDFPGARAMRGVSTIPGLNMRYCDDNGQTTWTRVSSMPLRDERGRIFRQVAVMTDIDGLKRTEETLQQSEASLQQRVIDATTELRTSSRRLLIVQEEERRRLALELHDEIGQIITGLRFQLAAAEGQNRSAPAAASATVQSLTEQVRHLALELRSQVLDRYGLLAAIEWFLGRYRERTGIAVYLREQGVAERRFPPEVEIAAFRVGQEALTNVARHAGVTEASVALLGDAGVLLVVVADQGCGSAPDQRPASRGVGGM